ncbi:SURP and G-patch domain-containing protein 1-like protein isoform X1 [Zingiber officinale]|uniref:SURP and G-patch domain-containing protein 1-like protein isoform X1 n=1 Tax=Zingiber officinale TaxID=94328 RepID=UPI001C4B761F|nr:SURP and G-patch domain-containing protein 1-like protein isoform X1 [Zingiber officinale]XP_042376962.1 SURP and G-patch domain-containing protein 1-like protein isoform X1 [Zingiber officinale]XP_042376963.1 SURP and G-patch domain-containing protein 1-like protein isoform X1 [Zingiber officinale]XP_042376964.1 SURP and G-patch domain-containing protein 1-like protein isoform X1 [Zingiber officinale]XP_042376966.1 SURP and G-patch domain-containing protein 1-like protein isoform X1 [Zingib
MDKRKETDLFVNDGHFMERVKQLQKEKGSAAAATDQPKPTTSASPSVALKPTMMVSKRPLEVKFNDTKKGDSQSSGGKLAFSLKQKTKVAAAPVKFITDEDEETEERVFGEEQFKRQKLGQGDIHHSSSQREDVAPSSPSDSAVKKVADKLASFVAKNGRQFEHVTRQRNPGDTPFKFLFDSNCSDYKYYEHRLLEEEKALAQLKEAKTSNSGFTSADNRSISTSRTSTGSQKSTFQQHLNYQTPASALYGSYEESSSSASLESGGASAADPIAKMEFYMKKAAQEERMRQPKQSKDEMPPPASLQAPKKGHHMGDFIPQNELDKFLSSCNDAAAQKAAKEAAEKAKIQADNIGHRLLSRMGWKEGEGLGSDKRGRSEPVMAGEVKKDHLGVGAERPGEVNPEDDIYEQYKKRMMLGYRYRPNPMNNPRKQYY